MNVYIARQPIFDRNMQIFGYELLYRKSTVNYFPAPTDDDLATTELIYNSFLVFGLDVLTDGTKAFINFSKSLIGSAIPLIMPKDTVIVEILERDKATRTTLEACRRLKKLGYTLAVDDFIFDENNSPLLEIADIIKIEYPVLDEKQQKQLITRYGHKIKFLAEKIETRDEFKRARKIGFDYFQGYFFSKPSVINSSEIISININLIEITNELNNAEPNIDKIADIIRDDLGLTYKVLKLVNSAYMGIRYEIKSIRQALTFIGLNELKKMMYLMLLKEMQNDDNAELIKLSMIRGKLMSLLASELNKETPEIYFFFTGIFSMVDILLNSEMSEVLSQLPLPTEVKAALTGADNELSRFLSCVIAHDSARWNEADTCYPMNIIGSRRFTELYVETLKWVKKIKY